MDFQILFNIATGLISVLIGVLIRTLWESLTSLRNQDAKLAEKVAKIEILVIGEYVKRDEFNRLSEALFRKLDKIDGKLDGKQDRGHHPGIPPSVSS